MSAQGSKKAVIFALGGNISIALIKYIVSFVTGSAAMLAESIHSTADCLNQVFLLIGNKKARQRPTEEYSFGFSREVFFWSLMVAVLLFFVGGFFSVYEGIKKIMHPEQIENIQWIFVVLTLSIIIEAKSFSVAYAVFRKQYKGPFFKSISASTDVNLVVILLEDFAALAGLFIVLATTLLAWLVHPIFDAIGSLLVGVLLIIISMVLITEVKKFIVGESLSREKRNQIKHIVKANQLVNHLNRFQSMVTGNNRFLVLLSVDVDNSTTAYKVEDAIDKMKQDIRKQLDGEVDIYIEVKDSIRGSRE
jgi:cation diffusion facilitator family transporter